MSRQLAAAPRRADPLTRRVTGYLWAHLRPPRSYPIVERTVDGNAQEIYNLCNVNRDVHRHNRPVQLSDDTWRVTVMITDREHPVPGTIARTRHRTWVAIRPTVKVGAIVLAVIAGLYGVGAIVWQVWGHEITAAVRLILAGTGTVIAALLLLTVGSWWTRHGSNGCSGLHCPGCGGH